MQRNHRKKNATSLVVMKFGGTSVEDAQAIGRVVHIVQSRRRHRRIVVVSALAKVTDQLVLMGQKAAAGDAGSLAPLLQSLRQRHLGTAKQLLESDLPTIAPKIENSFHQLEDFLHGVAAVRE